MFTPDVTQGLLIINPRVLYETINIFNNEILNNYTFKNFKINLMMIVATYLHLKVYRQKYLIMNFFYL